MSNPNNIVIFLDNISRTIIGSLVKSTEDQLLIENPAIVHVVPNAQTNQIQLQILPLFFKEFLKDRNNSLVWKFNKNSIIECEGMELSEQFVSQYLQLCGAGTPAPQNKDNEVIKLFDE